MYDIGFAEMTEFYSMSKEKHEAIEKIHKIIESSELDGIQEWVREFEVKTGETPETEKSNPYEKPPHAGLPDIRAMRPAPKKVKPRARAGVKSASNETKELGSGSGDDGVPT